MGYLKKLLTGGLAALTMALSSPSAEANPIDYMQMRKPEAVQAKKESGISNPELDPDDFKFNPVPEFLPAKKEKYNLELGPLDFIGSKFGSSSELNYIIPKGIELRPNGILYYNGLSFDVVNENFLDKLMFYAKQNMVLPTTPLDPAAEDIFNLPELKNRIFADLTLNQWFQVFKIFYNKTQSQFDGKVFSTKGDLSAKTNTFADIFSTLYFSRGDALLKYDHSIGYNVKADGKFGVKGRFKYGEGVNWGIHLLEKYIGSTFDMYYYYNAIASITASETHQFSKKVKNGWMGIGMNYQEFLYSNNFEQYRIGLKATMEQIEQLRLMDISIKDANSNDIRYGNSYFGYAYAMQSFKEFWYYAMAGGRFKDESVYSKKKALNQTIALNLLFRDDGTKNLIEQKKVYDRSSAEFDFSVAAGMNMGNIAHPYMAATSFPYNRMSGGMFLTVPRLVANFSVSRDEFTTVTNPRMEFFIPIVYTGEYTDALLNYFKESAIIDVSPLAAKYSYTENARMNAYSQLRGIFLSGIADGEHASLSFIINQGKHVFAELGVTSSYDFDGVGTYMRIGYKNVGMRAHYGYRMNGKKGNEGHHAGMSFVGDFGKYYVTFDMKGLWFKQPNYYLNTPLSYYAKEDKYVMMNFGFVW
ncbi:MAG: hypothetical protein V1906_03135 [Candidatus Woesearchaeota archaeon]